MHGHDRRQRAAHGLRPGSATLATGTYTVTENANAAKTIGTNAAPFVQHRSGADAARSRPRRPGTSAVAIGGSQTVSFGNSCYATANFACHRRAHGHERDVRALLGQRPRSRRRTDVTLTAPARTRTASVGSLRRGDVITLEVRDQQRRRRTGQRQRHHAHGYPSCAGSGSAQFRPRRSPALKYKDINADGNRDGADGENGLQGFSFQLKSGSTVVATTKSTATGLIEFQNVAPGSYTIHEVGRPPGWEQTEPAANGDASP